MYLVHHELFSCVFFQFGRTGSQEEFKEKDVLLTELAQLYAEKDDAASKKVASNEERVAATELREAAAQALTTNAARADPHPAEPSAKKKRGTSIFEPVQSFFDDKTEDRKRSQAALQDLEEKKLKLEEKKLAKQEEKDKEERDLRQKLESEKQETERLKVKLEQDRLAFQKQEFEARLRAEKEERERRYKQEDEARKAAQEERMMMMNTMKHLMDRLPKPQ